MSRLQLLRMLLDEAMRYREFRERIIPCSIRDFDFVEPRPLNTSMSPRKLFAALGREFEDPRESCRRIAAAHFGGNAAAQGAGHAIAR
jgi:hypothetical protein